MNAKRQETKKKHPIVVALTLLVALVAFLYTQGYLDGFLEPKKEATSVSMVKSTDPDRHIEEAKAALEELPQRELCSEMAMEDDYCQDLPKYDREGQFGAAWVDVDQDGCKTREQILERDMNDVTVGSSCKVESGTLEDPYAGKTITDRSKADIDHIYSLSAAHQLGAHDWPQGKRVAFANDPEINLLAVDGPTNQSDKSDKTLGEWMPETDYACTFAIKYIWAADAYGLAITPSDYKAAGKTLDSCDVVYGEPTDAEPLSEEVWAYAEKY